jgi:putrescine importer
VNVAAMRHFYLTPKAARRRRKFVRDFVLPVAGSIFCFWIWISLPLLAKTVGAVWLTLGVIYAFAMTGSLTVPPGQLDFAAAVLVDPSSAAIKEGSS